MVTPGRSWYVRVRIPTGVRCIIKKRRKMLIEYNDIKSRISEEPKWYTTQGVPRYCDFSPRETGVYVKYALLAEIQCQACHKSFLVGEGYNRENWNALMRGDEKNYMNDLNRIVTHYHYGDPPNHGCMSAGDTMNCEDIRFVEVWEQVDFEWQRRTDLEKSCEYWIDNLEKS